MRKDIHYIKKLRESHKEQRMSEKNRIALIKRLTGRKVSKETREKIKKSKLGKKVSKETKKRLSLAHKGQNAWNKGIPLTKEQIEKRQETKRNKWVANPELRKKQSEISRANLLRLYESNSFPKQTNTFPERMIKEELTKRGYREETDFIHQYKFMDKFMCDFCFIKLKVVVEIDGDFWHANPNKYIDKTKLHPHQIKGIGKDKSKNAYITKVDNGSWTLLRFWESDINKDVIKCVDKIEEVLPKKK